MQHRRWPAAVNVNAVRGLLAYAHYRGLSVERHGTSMKRKVAAFSALAAVALLNGSIFGAPQEAARLPFFSPIFGDNVVLQARQRLFAWFWATARRFR